MKVFKNINKTKKIVLITATFITLVLVISLLFYVVFLNGNLFGWKLNRNNEVSNPTRNTSINTDSPTDSQLDVGEQIKKDAIEQEQKQSTETDNIEVSVSAIQDNNMVRIRAIIDTISSTGICELIASKDSKVITKESGVQALPNYSTCKGFDIPTNELTTGQWQLLINFYLTDKAGSGSTKIVVE